MLVLTNPVLPVYWAVIYSHVSIGAFRKVAEFVFTSSISIDRVPGLLTQYVKSLPPGNYAIEVRDVMGGLISESYYPLGEPNPIGSL